ncbi:MAG TPA: hypothetical protein VGG11_18395 [Xanthobacteraceae bacterium]|jgi:hypothetical protein
MAAVNAVASYSSAMRYECGLETDLQFQGVKMVKTVLFASVAAALSFGASAQAMPLSNVGGTTSPSVVLVAGGCGVGWHPTPVGCRPNGGPVVVAPVVVPGPYWRGPGWHFYHGCWRGPHGAVHCD